MIGIRLYDKIFAHASCVGNNYETCPKHFRWVRSGGDLPVCVFTDFSLESVADCKGAVKIAWLVESPEVFPGPYQKVREIEGEFDAIFTFSTELLARGPKYMYAPLGGCWIKHPEIRPKSKGTSMVLSTKKKTSGQALRHEIMDITMGVDFYGAGAGLPIKDKGDALFDYRYSIAIENTRHDCYFSEKLIDCFATGTIPIYWGSPLVLKMFDPHGIRMLWEPEDFEYEDAQQAIRNNFEIAKRYMNTEDRLWEDHLREIVEGA